MPGPEGLEAFGVTVNVQTGPQARALEDSFRLPLGALAAGEQTYIAHAAQYMDDDGIGCINRDPAEALGVEFLPD